MINFRYYVVSLISVFLALAIGVVLGAGPLQNRINDAVEGEPAAEQTCPRDEVGEELATAISTQVLPEALDGKSVTLVALPGATDEDVDSVVDSLALAGAAVIGPVHLTEAFVSPDENTYRETLAAPISAHLAERPTSPDADNVIATGLVEALTIDGSDAELIADIITDEETPLVEELPDEPAETLVLVGSAVEGDPATVQMWVALADAVAASSVSSLAVGQAASPEQFIAALRSANTKLTTVDQGGSALGGLNVALVLASGAEGAFGTQDAATTVLAPLP